MDQNFYKKVERICKSLKEQNIVAIDYSFIEPLIIVNKHYDVYYVRRAVAYLKEHKIEVTRVPKTLEAWDRVSEKILDYRKLSKDERKEVNAKNLAKFNDLLARHKVEKKKKRTTKRELTDDETFANLDPLALYLKDFDHFPTDVLSREEEVALFEKYHQGDMEARNKIWTANVRLCYNYVRKTYGSKVSRETFEDLLQEVNLGIFPALEKFDLSRGLKFSTYAMVWIRQSASRAWQKIDKTITIPGPQVQQANNVLKAFELLTQERGVTPSDDDIAEYINEHKMICVENVESLSASDVDYYMGLYFVAHPISFSTPVGEDKEDTFGDFIPSEEKDSPESLLLKKDMKDTLLKAMETQLTEREETVIKMRFGFNENNKRYNLKEIGDFLGVSRERARQIETKALRKLRGYCTRIDME